MRNPWLAIDASTEPTQRARELRHAWERFVVGERLGDDEDVVREPIADSWRRSQGAGVDPSGNAFAPSVADDDEAAARWEVHPLLTSAPLIRECFAGIADDAAHVMVVSDADGTLLWLEGAASVRLAAANSMNFAVGALWSEGGAGTNAIGTALAADHAVQVFAAEHFNEVVQQWTCAAAPVHDPESGAVLGIVDLTSRMSTVHPHSFAVAVATAGAVEAHLRVSMHERDLRMRSRYSDLVSAGRDPRALVMRSGRVLASRPDGWTGTGRIDVPPWGGAFTLGSGAHAFAEPLDRKGAYLVRRLEVLGPGRGAAVIDLRLLTREPTALLSGRRLLLRRRQAEILALLCQCPDGCTTEQLGSDLYGDEAANSSVRGEVSRLRKLGVPISSEPYRLTVPIESDVARVLAMLRAGAVREAAEAYTGPLLPLSDAPGVVRRRDELDDWLRHAVLTGGDREALWAFAQSPAGRDDTAAWKLAVCRMDFHDPRRSQAAAQLRRLRAYGA